MKIASLDKPLRYLLEPRIRHGLWWMDFLCLWLVVISKGGLCTEGGLETTGDKVLLDHRWFTAFSLFFPPLSPTSKIRQRTAWRKFRNWWIGVTEALLFNVIYSLNQSTGLVLPVQIFLWCHRHLKMQTFFFLFWEAWVSEIKETFF